RFHVFMLINNAGFGGSKVFADAEISYIEKMILLNVMTPILLTHQLLPSLIQNQQSYILNIASMASFTPTAFKTVYPSTKRFLEHFSQGLREELKPYNISVSVAYPGPMNTNPEIANRIKLQGALANFMVFTPEKVAEVCIEKMLHKKSFILIGWGNKIIWLLLQILPTRFVTYWLSRAVKKELKDNL
ncbi:MAG: SDR family NAD(P)-dependent oxidoreductase, partial [Chitinophagaceae bacterium]